MTNYKSRSAVQRRNDRMHALFDKALREGQGLRSGPFPISGRSDLPGQMELPQTEERPAELAQMKAAAPLKPGKPQRPCDHGLFSDAAAQIDLVDIIGRKA